MKEIQKKLQLLGLVPVVKLDREEDALPLAQALCEGGLPCAEITFRTQAAEGAIRRIAQAFPEMLVGAGTVLTPEQADCAARAGAKFIVSPGLNPRVVSHCLEQGYPVIPGCATPSELEQALELGLRTVKFFPAEAAGGLPMIKAMAAPYPQVMFMPTGGIGPANLTEYLSFPKVLACGGSWMVKDTLIREGRFEEIRRLTQEAVHTMLGFAFDHLGMEPGEEDGANQLAEAFGDRFGFGCQERPNSLFAGPQLEIMKHSPQGRKGHIGIATNSVDRAQRYLESKGYAFDQSTALYTPQGVKRLIYLQEPIGGFAVHLVLREGR